MTVLLQFLIFVLITALGSLVPSIDLKFDPLTFEAEPFELVDCTDQTGGVCSRVGFETETRFGLPFQIYESTEIVSQTSAPGSVSVVNERALNVVGLGLNLALFLGALNLYDNRSKIMKKVSKRK